MHTVYLDQNHWIALAQAVKRPKDYPALQSLPGRIRAEVDAGRLRLPLTFTNIYETHKINDPERRGDLAMVQAFLSRGTVFRGRRRRREQEIAQVIASLLQLPLNPPENDWFLSSVFFEGAAEWDVVGQETTISERAVESIRSRPAECLYEYLVGTTDAVRTESVKQFSAGSERLRAMVEERRQKHAAETPAMRRKIYSALMMIDDVALILKIANDVGASWKQVKDIGSSNAHRIMNEVPTYYVEREIAVRLEAQNRPIEENDFRDMQAFCAVVPYADLVVGENQFVNLARQAGLDKKYNTRLATNLSALNEALDGWIE
ncbi:hypothetical protein [Rhizobium sp. ICMP 5592]|uniref:hypothetical protein n=1 Tax=Rhizobium sp. ICMP 5592 TaxID=2292445 RepID=UPI0012970A15|nr:hypothetical protein [Rhizobium sp. ICMP 5592]MQB46046.1 hypothetical protein [Rhizobium sp. ICMP 5592]